MPLYQRPERQRDFCPLSRVGGVPAMQIAQQQRRLGALPDQGRAVAVDERRAAGLGAGKK